MIGPMKYFHSKCKKCGADWGAAAGANVNAFHQDVTITTVDNTTTPTAIGDLFAWQLGVYGAGTSLDIDFIPRRYWY